MKKCSIFQRFFGTNVVSLLNLQLAVCREVEEEVVEQLVSRLRHRSLGYNLIQSVGHRLYTVSTDTVRIGHHRRLLV